MKFRHLALSLTLSSSMSSCVSELREASPRQQVEQLKRIPWKERGFGRKAHSALRKGATTSKPEKAIGLYLHAMQLLEPHKSRSAWAAKSYQVALGCSIDLLQAENLWDKPIPTQSGTITVAADLSKLAAHLQGFDTLHYADAYSNGILRPSITRAGRGVALTARKLDNNQHHAHYLPSSGQHFPLSAEAAWSGSDKLTITLHDSRKATHLAANFTTPLAFSARYSIKNPVQGVRNLYRPAKGLEQMRIYSDEPLDPERIPVVLVHGLASSPYLWLRPTHAMLGDEQVRKRYQFFYFYYPTGLPLAHSAAGLKSALGELHDTLKKHGAGGNAERMVLVGHSMGGLLSSAVTRDYTGAYSELYTANPQYLERDSIARRAITELLERPPLSCVDRVVFIATPHRGSSYADKAIGQFTSRLIKFPKRLFQVTPEHYQSDLTELGKKLFSHDANIDGVQRLKLGNPLLEYNLSKPKLPHVRYHSIIGNRGFSGSVEDSSDGVVLYQSAHLEKADSEKIVPAWHNAQSHPETCKELRRILRLHLESE